DEVFQNRARDPSQTHTESARRLLDSAGADLQSAGLPDPAHCLLAIHEARIALSRKPDDTLAYRLLSTAYRDLMIQESALLAGLEEAQTEQQASPVQLADFALTQGAPGLALQHLEEALQVNVNPAAVKPQLIDLYCDTGQAEKALDLLGMSTSIDDPALGAE